MDTGRRRRRTHPYPRRRKGLRKGGSEFLFRKRKPSRRIRGQDSTGHRHLVFCDRYVTGVPPAQSDDSRRSCKLSLSGEGDAAWFGGGTDLTPCYPYAEDAAHFHRVLRQACDRHDPSRYPRFKKWCDEYFTLKHRGEMRGIGGVFFDYLEGDREENFAFVCDIGNSFLEAYLPIAKRRMNEPFGEHERQYQLYRRGRYVEFILLYDQGP